MTGNTIVSITQFKKSMFKEFINIIWKLAALKTILNDRKR